jgi:hypothetical protein
MARFIAAALIVLLPCLAAGEERSSHAIIDWSYWDAILRSHVVDGEVDYSAIAEDEGFAATVIAIATADLVGSSSESVLAFYINAYNVLAVQGILNGRSPSTNLGKLRFFYREKYTVAGETISLHALEKVRIRSLGEPRIHFAIVCASASCPPLLAEAYLPHRLDAQLENNARQFINDPVKNRFDIENHTASVSRIFKWFAEDFEAAAGNVQGFLARYVDDDKVAETLRQGQLKLRFLDYDWSLNGSLGETKP